MHANEHCKFLESRTNLYQLFLNINPNFISLILFDNIIINNFVYNNLNDDLYKMEQIFY